MRGITWMLLTWVIAVSSSGTLAAQEAPEKSESSADGPSPQDPQTLRRKVNRLVRQLYASDLAERDAAEKELTELGVEILPLLPETSSRTPAEVLQRLGRVTSALESVAAKANLKASQVTLDGDLDFIDIFEAIEKQTGNRFTGYEDLVGTMQVEWKDTSYWEALDQVLDEAGVEPLMFSQTANIMNLNARPAEQRERVGSAAYSGVARFEVIRVSATRDLRNPQLKSLRATLRIGWEQRLSPISLTIPLTSLNVEDEAGNEIIAAASGGQSQLNVTVPDRACCFDIDVPLALPERDVAKIGKLSGAVSFLTPGRMETFQFDGDLLNARSVQVKKSGLTVILERVRKNMALYQVMVRLRYDNTNESMQSHMGLAYRNDAFLVSPSGKRIDPATTEQLGTRDNEVVMAYLFAIEGDLSDHRFALRAPAMILNRRVAFELSDVDLP